MFSENHPWPKIKQHYTNTCQIKMATLQPAGTGIKAEFENVDYGINLQTFRWEGVASDLGYTCTLSNVTHQGFT